MRQEQSAIKTTYFSIVSNTCLAIVKGLAGFFGNSYALIADAIESTTDIFSSLLVLFGLKYAKRPADENHPYGHGKIEPLITFLVVVFLVISAGVIAHESIQNIQIPHKSPKSWTLMVLGIIILWKEIFGCIVKNMCFATFFFTKKHANTMPGAMTHGEFFKGMTERSGNVEIVREKKVHEE